MIAPVLLLAAAGRVEAQTLIFDRFENERSAPTGWAFLTHVSATETPTGTPTETPTNTPSATPTETATLTPTPSLDLGEPCVSETQCESGFCVDGVCCERQCDVPDEACNATGQEGSCVPRPGVPAPVASHRGLLLMILALGGLAALQLRRSLRSG